MRYINLFGLKWKPEKLQSPLLLVQAVDQLPSDPSKSWAQQWPGLAECVATPGSHFGLLTEYVMQTAQTISGLLDNEAEHTGAIAMEKSMYVQQTLLRKSP